MSPSRRHRGQTGNLSPSPRQCTDEGGWTGQPCPRTWSGKPLRSGLRSSPMTEAAERQGGGAGCRAVQAITCPPGAGVGRAAAGAQSRVSLCVWFPDTVSSFKISNCLLVQGGPSAVSKLALSLKVGKKVGNCCSRTNQVTVTVLPAIKRLVGGLQLPSWTMAWRPAPGAVPRHHEPTATGLGVQVPSQH